MAPTLVIGKDSESVWGPRPFRFIRRIPDRGKSCHNVHHLDVKGRSFSCVLDEATYSELFSCLGFSVRPCGGGLFSSLNSVAGVAQPSSLVQTRLVHSRSEHFSGQYRLLSGEPSVTNRYKYKNDGRDGNGPAWPLFLILTAGVLINLFGGYLRFWRSIRPEGVRWWLFILGVLAIAVSCGVIHYAMSQFDERTWGSQRLLGRFTPRCSLRSFRRAQPSTVLFSFIYRGRPRPMGLTWSASLDCPVPQ